MSELKDYKVYTTRNEGAWGYHYEPNPNKDQSDIELNGELVYLKKDVDKVIAGKDAEIAELKDSIEKLLKAKTEQIMDEVMQKTLIYGEGFVPVEHVMLLVSELRHSNRKRCVAMAECRDAQARLFHRFGTEVMLNQLYGRNPAVDMERMDRRSLRCRLASQLWKKRAEKFKEAK